MTYTIRTTDTGAAASFTVMVSDGSNEKEPYEAATCALLADAYTMIMTMKRNDAAAKALAGGMSVEDMAWEFFGQVG